MRKHEQIVILYLIPFVSTLVGLSFVSVMGQIGKRLKYCICVLQTDMLKNVYIGSTYVTNWRLC